MHFTKNLSTFVVSALLATSATTELTKAPRDIRSVIERDGTSKTGLSLHARAEEVPMGKTGGTRGKAISTSGLDTCIGLLIMGKQIHHGDDKWDRVLGHLSEEDEEWHLDDIIYQFETFKKKVKEMDLENQEGWFTAVDVSSLNAEDWEDDMKEMLQETINDVRSKFKDLVGGKINYFCSLCLGTSYLPVELQHMHVR
ncbi:Uu.00g009880.m01.CDS01 [Anthostomella pinea]|uniref:Uu.00g009880.m01.CDS01 n=1 Tax=Anthostomella pinea TaxID=933095 RepID=A0AAI8VY49_9PEZI|nr:Uu.00g009880.m01.CDS01 [Anthostomella pinea]